MANLWKRHLSAAELTTILVVVVPIFIIWIAVGIKHKQDRRPVMDLSNLRQISAAFDAYATDNHDYGPGLDSRGKIRYATVEDRYLSLLKPVYISPDALVSVYDEKTQWTAGRISSANYSYSMLQLPTTGGRLSQ